MNNLDRLVRELSEKTAPKSTFEDKKVPTSRLDENLNEDLKAMMAKAQSWLNSAGKKIAQRLSGAKLFLRKVGNKIFPFYKRGKEIGAIDPKSGKAFVKSTGSSSKRTILINTNLIANESKDVLGKLLKELKSKGDIEKIATKEIDTIGQEVQDVAEAPDDALDYVNTAEVDFDDLYEILDQTAFGLKYRTSYKQDVPSLLIMGPPGAAKTSVIKQFASDRGMKIKVLEISSLYKEILGGFPIVQKILIPSLFAPFYRLLENAGYNQDEIQGILTKMIENPTKVYDVENAVFGDPKKLGIFDATLAVEQSLKNAISISSVMGTLGGIVAFPRDHQLEHQDFRDEMDFRRSIDTASDLKNEANERP